MKILKKLILSIVGLGACVATFTATTFAWFSISQRADIEGLNFQAVSGLGFEISTYGKNTASYSQNINGEQIQMAILQKIEPTRFEIKDESYIDEDDVKHQNTYLIDKSNNNKVLNNEEMIKFINERIELKPITSLDGINYFDQYNNEIQLNEGKYLEFDLYFRTKSKYKTEGKVHNIYLSNETQTIDSNSKQVIDVNPSKIVTTPYEMELNNSLTILDKDYNQKDYKAKDYITTNLANALRLSIQDSGVITVKDSTDANSTEIDEITDIKDTSLIYELTDTSDLGSYATNYSGDEDELNRLYNYKYNAMYTYNTSLNSVPFQPLDYNLMPNTIRTLDDKDAFVTLTSGLIANKVTFRIWLEGYDADYFVGNPKITEISANFSFLTNN